MSTQGGKVEQNAMNKMPESVWAEIDNIYTKLTFGISAIDVIGMAANNVEENTIGETTEVLKAYFKNLLDRLMVLTESLVEASNE